MAPAVIALLSALGLGWVVMRWRGSAPSSGQPSPLALPASSMQLEAFASSSTRPVSPAPSPPNVPRRPTRPLPPSDFVPRLRAWLQTNPPPAQIEELASALEIGGFGQTARGLRRHAQRVASSGARARSASDPQGPASKPAPGTSSAWPSENASDNSRSSDESTGAPLPRSADEERPDDGDRGSPLRALAHRVAASLLRSQSGSTDRNLVRQFQREARLFSHGRPSGLYGPATRDALVRHGVQRPPRPRFRAELEAAPASSSPASSSTRPAPEVLRRRPTPPSTTTPPAPGDSDDT